MRRKRRAKAEPEHDALRRAPGPAAEEKPRASLDVLRDANEQLVFTTLRAEAAVTEADKARRAAEEDRQALEVEAELRERLMGIVGHDLRNPLASILMAAQLLAQTSGLRGQSAEVLAGIERSARRMKGLVEDLLDVTRLHQSGSLSVNPAPTDLRDICLNVVRELELGRGAAGRFDCSFEGPTMGSWDSTRLAQVISNIAGNALTYGDRTSLITLRARGSDDSVLLEIHNQGEPIPAELLPALFLPFKRGQRRRDEDESAGLGLGLYIASELVRAHGGTLDVTSTADDGTTFRIGLPR